MIRSQYSNPLPNTGSYGDIATSIRACEIDKGGNAVQRSINAVYHLSSEDLRFNLLFGAAYPLFLVAEIIGACVTAPLSHEDAPRSKSSVFAAAKDNAAIAISYAFMARSTLQIFARRTRSERLS